MSRTSDKPHAAYRAILCAGVCLAVAGCVAPQTTLLPRESYTGIGGEVSVNAQREKAGAASTADDLGLSADGIFMPEVELDWRRWHASAEFFRTSYAGRGRASGALSFGDVALSPAVLLETKASFDYAIAAGLYDFYVRGNTRFAAGLGAGVAAYDLYFRQVSPPPLELAFDDRLPFGYLTIRVAHDFGDVGLWIAASGLAYSSKTSDIDYVEFEGRGDFPLFRVGRSGVGHGVIGFRYHRLQYVWTPPEGTLDLDLDLYGPYLGLGYTF